MTTTTDPNSLRHLRSTAGISVTELAARVGVSRQTVWAWEQGRRDIPTGQAEQLGAVFGVSPAIVMGWD